MCTTLFTLSCLTQNLNFAGKIPFRRVGHNNCVGLYDMYKQVPQLFLGVRSVLFCALSPAINDGAQCLLSTLVTVQCICIDSLVPLKNRRMQLATGKKLDLVRSFPPQPPATRHRNGCYDRS